jgi:hypothetical protein
VLTAQQPAVVQEATTGYMLTKLVAAMPTSTVYAIDTIVGRNGDLKHFPLLKLSA